jgi:hypothetical protein
MSKDEEFARARVSYLRTASLAIDLPGGGADQRSPPHARHSASRTPHSALVTAALLLAVAPRAVGSENLLPNGSFEPGADCNVAIFKDDIPPSGAPADPDELAELLRQPGWRVGWLDSEQLADPQGLNREHIDVLVLPYGASFPVKAAGNFRRFLRAGGGFVSVGGYAFDNLLERTPAGWRPPSTNPPAVDHAQLRYAVPAPERLNTRFGIPEDDLRVAPTQLGVFDAAPLAAGGQELEIRVTPDQAYSLLLVCDQGAAARWGKLLARTVPHPASLP